MYHPVEGVKRTGTFCRNVASGAGEKVPVPFSAWPPGGGKASSSSDGDRPKSQVRVAGRGGGILADPIGLVWASHWCGSITSGARRGGLGVSSGQADQEQNQQSRVTMTLVALSSVGPTFPVFPSRLEQNVCSTGFGWGEFRSVWLPAA